MVSFCKSKRAFNCKSTSLVDSQHTVWSVAPDMVKSPVFPQKKGGSIMELVMDLTAPGMLTQS